MDRYSPEDAAGDLMLEVGEPRPTHDLRTPGAWRWLAPLAVCVTFAGAVGISILAVPEPASFEVAEPLPGMSAPDHVEPLAERAMAALPVAPADAPEAEASPLAPDPATLASASPAVTDVPAPRPSARGAAARPIAPVTNSEEPDPAPPQPARSPAPQPNADGDDDLPAVDLDDDDEGSQAPAEDDASVLDDAAPTDEDALGDAEPALPGAGA